MLQSIKTAKFANVVSFAIAFVGLLYVAYSLYCVWVGIGQVEPFRNFHDLLLGSIGGLTLGEVAKGAEKVKGNGLPFNVTETTTKGGKVGYAIHLPKTEAGNEIAFTLRMLCTAAQTPFFSWPSKNENKEKFVTYGVMASGIDLVLNYQKTDLKSAREVGEANKKAKTTEREAKKEAKQANKNGGSVVLAKIQAYKDLHAEGLITVEVMMSKIDALGQ